MTSSAQQQQLQQEKQQQTDQQTASRKSFSPTSSSSTSPRSVVSPKMEGPKVSYDQPHVAGSPPALLAPNSLNWMSSLNTIGGMSETEHWQRKAHSGIVHDMQLLCGLCLTEIRVDRGYSNMEARRMAEEALDVEECRLYPIPKNRNDLICVLGSFLHLECAVRARDEGMLRAIERVVAHETNINARHASETGVILERLLECPQVSFSKTSFDISFSETDSENHPPANEEHGRKARTPDLGSQTLDFCVTQARKDGITSLEGWTGAMAIGESPLPEQIAKLPRTVLNIFRAASVSVRAVDLPTNASSASPSNTTTRLKEADFFLWNQDELRAFENREMSRTDIFGPIFTRRSMVGVGNRMVKGILGKTEYCNAAQLEELGKLPEWIRPMGKSDVLNWLRSKAQFMEVRPHMEMSSPGVVGGVREEICRMRLVSVNHHVETNGGGSIVEWGIIQREYVVQLRKAVLRAYEFDICKREGKWYPDVGFCIRHGIPIHFGLQKPDEVFTASPGVIHWNIVHGVRPVLCSRWNIFERSVSQFELAFEKDDIQKRLASDSEDGHLPKFESLPLYTLALDLCYAETVRATQSKNAAWGLPFPIFSVLTERLNMILKEEEKLRYSYAPKKFSLEPMLSCVLRCEIETCGREIFHHYTYCHTCDTASPKDALVPSSSQSVASSSSYTSSGRRKPRSPVPSWLRLNCRVIVNETGEVGQVVKSGHGFYAVQLKGSTNVVLKRRSGLSSPGAELLNVIVTKNVSGSETICSSAGDSAPLSQSIRCVRARPAVMCLACGREHLEHFGEHLILAFEKISYTQLQNICININKLAKQRKNQQGKLSELIDEPQPMFCHGGNLEGNGDGSSLSKELLPLVSGSTSRSVVASGAAASSSNPETNRASRTRSQLQHHQRNQLQQQQQQQQQQQFYNLKQEQQQARLRQAQLHQQRMFAQSSTSNEQSARPQAIHGTSHSNLGSISSRHRSGTTQGHTGGSNSGIGHPANAKRTGVSGSTNHGPTGKAQAHQYPSPAAENQHQRIVAINPPWQTSSTMTNNPHWNDSFMTLSNTKRMRMHPPALRTVASYLNEQVPAEKRCRTSVDTSSTPIPAMIIPLAQPEDDLTLPIPGEHGSAAAHIEFTPNQPNRSWQSSFLDRSSFANFEASRYDTKQSPQTMTQSGNNAAANLTIPEPELDESFQQTLNTLLDTDDLVLPLYTNPCTDAELLSPYPHYDPNLGATHQGQGQDEEPEDDGDYGNGQRWMTELR